jgi:HlyD family secretion protein
MKKVAIVFVVLVLGLSIGLWIKVRENKRALEGPTGGSGVIEGLEADVSARLPARILEIRADEGAAVEKGQPLVLLDCREQNAVLDAARAKLEATEKTAGAAKAQVQAAMSSAAAADSAVDANDAQTAALKEAREVTSRQAERITKLQGEGGATAMELDRATTQVRELGEQLRALEARTKAAKGQATAARAQAEAAREQAEAALAAIVAARADVERARATVDECTLVAPISGMVLSRAYEPGEVTLPGTRVLTLVAIENVEATFYVPNAELAGAVPGRPVIAVADAFREESFRGEIVAVAAKAEFTPRNVQTREDRDRLVYAVKARFPNPGKKLRPGMPVEVSIPGTEGDRR